MLIFSCPTGTSAKYLTMSAALPQLLLQKSQPKDARKDVQDLMARRAKAQPKDRPASAADDSDAEDWQQEEDEEAGVCVTLSRACLRLGLPCVKRDERKEDEEASSLVQARPVQQEDRKRKQASDGAHPNAGQQGKNKRKKHRKNKQHAQPGLSLQNMQTLRLD